MIRKEQEKATEQDILYQEESSKVMIELCYYHLRRILKAVVIEQVLRK